MIQVDGLSIAFQGHLLFDNATFTIQEGERCGLVGRNGSGKSTLFRLLTGQETSDGGTIAKARTTIIGALSQHIHFTEPAILAEAALSFLGLGTGRTYPYWGQMIALGRDYINVAWWLSTFPGLAILLTVLSINLIGDRIRDVLDPRST